MQITKKSIDNAMRRSAVDDFIKNKNLIKDVITVKQLQQWKSIDDEWQNHDLSKITEKEAEVLIKKSELNAAKRKRMGFASTAQLRLIEYKSGLRQPRTMTSKEASEKIATFKK